MKKFLKVISFFIGLLAIPFALIYKYPEKSKDLYNKGKDKGKKAYQTYKKKSCGCDECDCEK
jgi:hypothetical protein